MPMIRPRWIVLVSCLGFLVGLNAKARGEPANKPTAYEKACDDLIKRKGSLPEAERLRRLFKLDWRYNMTEYPESATYNGYPGQNDRWTDLSLAAIERRKRELEAPARVLHSINRNALSPADQINYDLFLYNTNDALAGREFPSELLPVDQMDGAQKDSAEVLDMMPAAKLKDYEDRLARLRALPLRFEQVTLLMKEGLRRGVTHARIAMQDVPNQVAAQMSQEVLQDPLKSPMLASFREFPESIPKADQERLRKQAKEIVLTAVIPTLKAFHEFLVMQYLPGCREDIAWASLPNGQAWYAYEVRHHTTTKLTAKQIHEIGLKEVERIRGEMEKVISSTGFKGSIADFFKFIRTDPRFFFEDPSELVRSYRDIAKRIDPALPKLFGKLPRLTYGVLPVPSYSEKSQPTAYYMPGAPEAGRAGYFFANTYKVNTRPKWEMEALTLHEAVPGHHLQIALSQEMENVPDFRKFGGYTAFVEGWGLYAESLGKELGMYEEPYANFGRLTYEMWRAIRLVVDTGMHELGWSRQKAIDFFTEHAGKSEHDIAVEVDRYLVMPGQALAYKIGELKLKELRARATEALGDRFDVRGFHDAVLSGGALPMEVLESRVSSWMRHPAAR